ncbi:hypothetical protein J3A83DRAFT_4186419 [Scleroderma citrinum]
MKTYLAIWVTHTTHQVSMQNPWKAVVTQKTQSQGWFIMGMPTVHTHTQVVQGGGGCHQHPRVVLVLMINADDGEMVITLSMLVVVFNTGGHIISTDGSWKPAENTALNVRVKTHLLLQVKPQRPTGQSHWVSHTYDKHYS